jgi:glycerol-3-phosphate dehydrogenase
VLGVGFDRGAALRRLADEHLDVLVVGGGITGAGVALDAVTRGLRTGLVERHDFASGTSSRSSKLVHGGLRYLQQGDVRLVRESLAERHRLLRNAPNLVHPLPFVLPVADGGPVPRRLRHALAAALWTYDLSGGARIGRLHRRLSTDDLLESFPTLDPERVRGGFLYWDAQTDDARLTLAVARTAAAYGAAVANHVAAVGIGPGSARLRTAEGDDIDVRARVVVNASGVWSDEVRTMEEGAHRPSIRAAKGVHVVVPRSVLGNGAAAVLRVPADGRSIFVVPFDDHTYIGTTDTDHRGPLDDPRCTDEDARYLLDALGSWLTTPVGLEQVTARWAGLRPLVASGSKARTADLSRRHRVERHADGMISVTGGKLTTYRRMAVDTVDAVMDALDRRGRSITRDLPLHDDDERVLAAMVQRDPSLGAPLIAGLPYLRVAAVHAARAEMARTLDDVLTRRVPAAWLDAAASAAAAPDAARLVAPELGWDTAAMNRQVARFRATLSP